VKVSCPSCGKSFAFDDARFGDRASVKVRCPSCKGVVALTRPPAAVDPPAAGAAAEPGPPGPPAPSAEAPSGSPTQKLKRDQVVLGTEGGEVLLPMPQGRRVSLAILSGKNSGEIIPCQKPRVVIGRTGADVNLEDDEVSRRHAVVEIRDDRYFLKDLGSTNGTFVDERRVTEAEIFDKGEFRIGSTQIMIIVTPDEEV
jgi:predicted Zn finger-like uncharacterized protein